MIGHCHTCGHAVGHHYSPSEEEMPCAVKDCGCPAFDDGTREGFAESPDPVRHAKWFVIGPVLLALLLFWTCSSTGEPHY